MTKGRRRALLLRGDARFFFARERFAAAAISTTSVSLAGRCSSLPSVMLSRHMTASIAGSVEPRPRGLHQTLGARAVFGHETRELLGVVADRLHVQRGEA